MVIYCQFLPLKNDEGTPNEKAAELFGSKQRIRNYCTNHECPNGGEIDGNMQEKRGVHFGSGFVPLSCYNNWILQVSQEIAQADD